MARLDQRDTYPDYVRRTRVAYWMARFAGPWLATWGCWAVGLGALCADARHVVNECNETELTV
jgi:hypothetical protein